MDSPKKVLVVLLELEVKDKTYSYEKSIDVTPEEYEKIKELSVLKKEEFFENVLSDVISREMRSLPSCAKLKVDYEEESFYKFMEISYLERYKIFYIANISPGTLVDNYWMAVNVSEKEVNDFYNRNILFVS